MKFDYKRRVITFWLQFVQMAFKWGFLDMVIFWFCFELEICDLIFASSFLNWSRRNFEITCTYFVILEKYVFNEHHIQP